MEHCCCCKAHNCYGRKNISSCSNDCKNNIGMPLCWATQSATTQGMPPQLRADEPHVLHWRAAAFQWIMCSRTRQLKHHIARRDMLSCIHQACTVHCSTQRCWRMLLQGLPAYSSMRLSRSPARCRRSSCMASCATCAAWLSLYSAASCKHTRQQYSQQPCQRIQTLHFGDNSTVTHIQLRPAADHDMHAAGRTRGQPPDTRKNVVRRACSTLLNAT